MNEIVILKVGTSTLTKQDSDGQVLLDRVAFRRLGKQVRALRARAVSVVIVSSAAIAAGMAITGQQIRPSRASSMPELQRLASIGWRHVLAQWAAAMPGETVGELLLTRHELDVTGPRQEALGVLRALLAHGDVPIINENDAISHEEIAYGDNDKLAAVLAACVATSPLFSARVRLVLLTDVYGVYADKHDSETRLAHVTDLQACRGFAGESASSYGTGGMAAKIAAAELAGKAGVETWIAHGRQPDALAKTLSCAAGTHIAVCENGVKCACVPSQPRYVK